MAADDFMKDYQRVAQQSWDSWTRQFTQGPAPVNPFVSSSAAAKPYETDALERTLAGLKGYFDWVQGVAVGAGTSDSANDWQQQLQQLFSGVSQPFSQAFGGIDTAGAESFTRQWQSWLQATQQGGHGGLGDLSGSTGPIPAFGLNREQQMQQQEMMQAMFASMQANARYQALLLRVNADGMTRLQGKLEMHAEPGRQIESFKVLYDLWVDATEEAYAEIALSDEFRDVYADMVNTQMRVRKMQQQQTEKMCLELGVPTRSEVSSLGERLQALRREFRQSQASAADSHADDEIVSLRREVAALKRKLAEEKAVPAKKAAPAKKATQAPTRGKAAAKTTSAPKRKSPVASKSTTTTRKRK